ncbi:hypothetical protein [Tenacibaculum sp.]|uniref:hypothetical protein n=1 Tax=Tenacibaculum sp. TaxID=1906242 RepID=UPI003AA83E95
MKRTVRIAIIAMMGISLGVNAQWVSNGDNSTTGGIIINGGTSGSNFKRKFDYNGGGWARTLIEYENSLMSSDNFKIGLYGGRTDHIYSYLGYGNYNDLKNLRIYPNGNTYFGGNIGVGTATPQAKLNVQGTFQVGTTTNYDAGVLSTSYENGSLYLNMIEYDDPLVMNFKQTLNPDYHEKIYFNKGGFGIGISDTKGFKLGVNGKVAATEVKVATYANWADFVFYEDYQLPTLTEVEKHIKEKGHLKDIPSAKEVEKNGFFLGAMDAKLLQKIEELTLYTIEQDKNLKTQNSKIEAQEKEIEELKKQNSKIKELEKLVKQLLKDKK